MRISNDTSEESYAAFLDLAGGNSALVMKALEPHADGTPVTFEEALDRIVDLRLEADRTHANLLVVR